MTCRATERLKGVVRQGAPLTLRVSPPPENPTSPAGRHRSGHHLITEWHTRKGPKAAVSAEVGLDADQGGRLLPQRCFGSRSIVAGFQPSSKSPLLGIRRTYASFTTMSEAMLDRRELR